MKELTKGKTMTLKEIAEATGASYSTVAAYAQKAGWTENGKQTLLNESQVTIILEAMKTQASSGAKSNLLNEIEGIDTSQSRALRIDLFHKRIEEELQAEIAELKAKAEADRPKVELYDQCMESGSLMSISTMAKKLERSGLGPRKIFAFLQDRKILFRNSGGYWVPYQNHIDLGRFVVKQIPRTYGETVVVDDVTKVTQKGFAYVERLMSGAFPLEATA